MDDKQWDQIRDYAAGLFPKLDLTDDERSLWHDELGDLSYGVVRQALGKVYAASRYKTIKLPEVLDALRVLDEQSRRRLGNTRHRIAQELEREKDKETDLETIVSRAQTLKFLDEIPPDRRRTLQEAWNKYRGVTCGGHSGSEDTNDWPQIMIDGIVLMHDEIIPMVPTAFQGEGAREPIKPIERRVHRQAGWAKTSPALRRKFDTSIQRARAAQAKE